MQEELIIAGAGGQGGALAGEVLRLAVVEEDKNTTTGYPSYGAATRGGKSTDTVIISSEEIGSPISAHPDSLIVMNRPSLLEFAPKVKPNGLMLVNTSLADWQGERKDIKVIEIKATDIAQKLGDVRVANMVMLGAYVKIKGIVSLESVIKALRDPGLIVKRGLNETIIALNQKALERGFNEVNKPCA